MIPDHVTPVEMHAQGARRGASLWVKRDDRTHPLYGGNKVRKLRRLLPALAAAGHDALVTVGATGSHHVLATAIFGRQAGFDVAAVVVPQPVTAAVTETFRASLAQGATVHAARTWAAVPFLVARAMGRRRAFVPPGGSTVDGTLGYVDGARELAVQVRAGLLPEPDLVVVTLGSGGTVAGLAAGFALEGLRTRVHGILVSEPPWAVEALTAHLIRAAVDRIDPGAGAALRRDALRRVAFVERFRGAGYGHPTPWGARARVVGSAAGLALDDTYTAKTFAAALDLVADVAAPVILYWHTLSSAPMAPLLAGAPGEEECHRRFPALFPR